LTDNNGVLTESCPSLPSDGSKPFKQRDPDIFIPPFISPITLPSTLPSTIDIDCRNVLNGKVENTVGNKVRLGKTISALGFKHKEHAHVAYHEVVPLKAA
jgi:hypothetical protein